MKSAQGTIKILLKSDFSSDLTHFRAMIGVSGGGGALPKRYEVTALTGTLGCTIGGTGGSLDLVSILTTSLRPHRCPDHQTESNHSQSAANSNVGSNDV